MNKIHQSQIFLFTVFLIVIFGFVTCSKTDQEEINCFSLEKFNSNSSSILFNKIAARIIEETGFTRGICVEADSINGRLSIALSKKSKSEFYALTKNNIEYADTLTNIKKNGDC